MSNQRNNMGGMWGRRGGIRNNRQNYQPSSDSYNNSSDDDSSFFSDKSDYGRHRFQNTATPKSFTEMSSSSDFSRNRNPPKNPQIPRIHKTMESDRNNDLKNSYNSDNDFDSEFASSSRSISSFSQQERKQKIPPKNSRYKPPSTNNQCELPQRTFSFARKDDDFSPQNKSRRGRGRQGRAEPRGGQQPYSNNRGRFQQRKPDLPIDSFKAVFSEIKYKQRQKNLAVNLLNDIDKIKLIFQFVRDYQNIRTRNPDVMEKQAKDAFFEICHLFTMPDISNADFDTKTTLLDLFFEDGFTGKTFFFGHILSLCCQDIAQNEIKESDLAHIINLFYLLIITSNQYKDAIEKNLKMIERLIQNIEKYKHFLESIHEASQYNPQTNLINRLESTVVPTKYDLSQKQKFNTENKINSKWETIDKYKDVMTILTKENFYFPFRNNLNNLLKKELDPRDLFLYEGVKISFLKNPKLFYLFKDCTTFLDFRIRLPPGYNKKITVPSWEKTERLGNNSLLILSTSPDLLRIDAICKSCACARASNEKIAKTHREMLKQGIVPISILKGEIHDNTTYYAFEPTSSWSAVQPILNRLQMMNTITFPKNFTKPILDLYFHDNEEVDRNTYNPNVLLKDDFGGDDIRKKADEDWIFDDYSKEQKRLLLRVDEEQYSAIRYALKNKLTLINGAPGTGKTHLAREFLRILHTSPHSRPVAIITYTNHSLDAFLEGILDFIKPDEFIRWGGPPRTQNPKILKRRWNNKFLTGQVLNKRDINVTKKTHLRNLFNIRQMIFILKQALKSRDVELDDFLTVLHTLENYIDLSKLDHQYRINFSPQEMDEYNRYLKYNKKGKETLKQQPLPDTINNFICWFEGANYRRIRDSQFRQILIFNRKIVQNLYYQNRFAGLLSDSDEFDDEGEEKDQNDNDFENRPSLQDLIQKTPQEAKHHEITLKFHEDVEEEEEENDDRIFGDEDIIEMVQASLEDSVVNSELPTNYIDFITQKFCEMISNDEDPKNSLKSFLNQIYRPITPIIKEIGRDLHEKEAEFYEYETYESGNYLKGMKLIAMTSTVASVRKEALEQAGCEILLIEEAGELTESMTSCILPNTLKRLILIGDYQQLRPKVEYELTKSPYHYDISLFEKLVKNARDQNARCLFTLSIQRRMHPQISSLIRKAFYPPTGNYGAIEDDPSTRDHGIPNGIPFRVRFYMHDFPQKAGSGRSYENQKEAQIAASLVPFFICRGYKPSDITIIALYKGQLFAIKRELDKLYKHPSISNQRKTYDSFGGAKPSQIKVVILDNFQGEENKITIVSLTRSDKPGFVKNRNRSLVTLSRARDLLIVLGNKKIFGQECESDIWKNISKECASLHPLAMSTPDQKGIAVNKCRVHNPGNDMPSFLSTPKDIIHYRFNYCSENCNFLLSCGHRCHLLCHCQARPTEQDHQDYNCPEPCPNHCPNGHPCRGRCGDCKRRGECLQCKEKIHMKLPCGHEGDFECWLVTSKKVKCKEKCGKLLECGHRCTLACGHQSEHDCKTELSQECPRCKGMIKYFCGFEPICKNQCGYTHPCGHRCEGICSVCIKEGHCECNQKCSYIFPCGHECPYHCSDKFPKHQHYLCKFKMNRNHHGHIINELQDCSSPLRCKSICNRQCEVCKLSCRKICSQLCRPHCHDQCQIKCAECHEQCRAFTTEKCAIFCPHHIKDKPPEDDKNVFVFHDDHWMTYDKANEAIQKQMDEIMGENEQSVTPIKRLCCPFPNCKYTLNDSWVFDNEIKTIEKLLGEVYNEAQTLIQNDKSVNPVRGNWYRCQCGKVFYQTSLTNEIDTIQCPKCGKIRSSNSIYS